MNAKQKFLTLLAITCVSLASTSFASELVYHDSNGNLHFKPSKESRTIMKTEDMNEYGFWIVPQEQAKKGFVPAPVHEIMGMTEEEFTRFSLTNENWMPDSRRFDGVIVPVNEVLDLTEDEYEMYMMGEGSDRLPNRFVKPGQMYNPATWGVRK